MTTRKKYDKKITPKQVGFASAYVKLGNASDAYREHYNVTRMKPETIHRAAKELLDNPKVAERIAQIKAKLAQRNEVTTDSLVKELEEARSLAKEAANPSISGMVAASMGKGKLSGLLVDKSEVDINLKAELRIDELTKEERKGLRKFLGI